MKDKEIIVEAKNILMLLIEAIGALTFDEYTQKISILSNGSIGEHTRHIIELFQQLVNGYESSNIDYDNRKRNIEIQVNIDFAEESIAKIISELDKKNKNLTLKTTLNEIDCTIETNYFRELLYNIEHCVHHQAILKIAFLSLGKHELSENFGVAKSTIKFRKECAQ